MGARRMIFILDLVFFLNGQALMDLKMGELPVTFNPLNSWALPFLRDPAQEHVSSYLQNFRTVGIYQQS